MVEEHRKRVEDEMTKLINNIDRNYLRRMQGDMHRCAAKCCDNETGSVHRLNDCVNDCSKNLNEAQNYIQEEFQRIQNRLQRCVMDCNDKVRDKIGPNPSSDDQMKYTAEFEKCASKCVDSYCDMMPSLEKNIKANLTKYT